MGAAARQRGDKLIRGSLGNKRPVCFEIMDRLNAIQKNKDAGWPFGPLVIKSHQGFFHLLDAKKQWSGFGYWYSTMKELMQRWNIELVGYDQSTDTWQANPIKIERKTK